MASAKAEIDVCCPVKKCHSSSDERGIGYGCAAISAVDPEFANMMLMAERHGLIANDVLKRHIGRALYQPTQDRQ